MPGNFQIAGQFYVSSSQKLPKKCLSIAGLGILKNVAILHLLKLQRLNQGDTHAKRLSSEKTSSPRLHLIELLVVIAIIAILAAILFPVFARARENARAASCLSNMKQMGLAIEMYKQDYDSWYPFGARKDPGVTTDWYHAFLEPYIKNDQVIHCPSQPDDWTIGYSYNEMFGYYMNDSRAGDDTVRPTICNVKIPIFDGINEAGVTEPSTSIILTEGTLYYNYLISLGGTWTPAKAASNLTIFFPNSNPATMAARFAMPAAGIHNGGVNNTYADGHVKWQILSNVVKPDNWCSLRG